MNHSTFFQFVQKLFWLATLTGLLLGSATDAPGATNATLCVMTYNLRYASPNPPNAWPQRRPLVREVIERVAPAVPKGPRIDWILTRGSVRVDLAETLTFSRDGQFPSDHFPVVARLRFVP